MDKNATVFVMNDYRGAKQSRDIAYTTLPDAGAVLVSVIGHCGVGETLEELFTLWPNLKGTCHRLTRYLYTHIPSLVRYDSLLEQCLVEGVKRRNAVRTQPLTESDDHNACVEFLTGLFHHLPDVLQWAVYVEGENASVWDPIEESLGDWWSKHHRQIKVAHKDSLFLHETPISRVAARKIIACRILSRTDIVAIGGDVGRIYRDEPDV